MSDPARTPVKRNLVDTELLIQNKSIESVYTTVIDWMEQENCNIKKQIKPKLIEAQHGTSITLSLDPDKWKKKFTFLLNQVENDTIIRMIINPPWYERIQSNENETIRNWLEFTKELWEIL